MFAEDNHDYLHTFLYCRHHVSLAEYEAQNEIPDLSMPIFSTWLESAHYIDEWRLYMVLVSANGLSRYYREVERCVPYEGCHIRLTD